MNITDIYEDSPNGYLITTDAPPNTDDAIKYYLGALEIYPPAIYPLEFGIVNYGMGCLLYADKSKPLFGEERAKRVENALYHFNHALEIFNYKDYPVMFGLISIFMSHLFLERANLINPRSFLAKRSTPEESVQYGLDTILEVFPVVYHSNKHILEHCMCCFLTGWLYVCQSEYLDNIQNNSIREQAITYLERCVRIVKQVRAMTLIGTTVLVLHNHNRDDKKHKVTKAGSYLEYNPQMVSQFPFHVRLFCKGYSLAYVEGTAYYLLGRLHQGWLTITVRNAGDEEGEEKTEEKVNTEEPLYTRNRKVSNEGYDGTLNRPVQQLSPDDPDNMDSELYNYRQAFEYLSMALRPKYLTNDVIQWADAHHRIAIVVIKYPIIIDPDYIAPGPPTAGKPSVRNSDLYLECAISHLTLALRSPLISPPVHMDINFHIAQCYITKLQLVIDSTPIGQSVTKNIIATDSLETLQNIEKHLKEAVKRVTAASTQTTQEGYLYYFSCLKVSEYRMLEAACRPELSSDDRNFFLKDSVEYLVDAMMSRSLVDNVDLHYVACAQMSAMLMSCKKTFAACKSLCKTLMVLCVMLNRSLFNPETAAQLKLADEMIRQTTQAMLASSKDVFWVKKHFGAFSLNERLQAGYATWSFEDGPNVKIDESKMITDFSATAPNNEEGTLGSGELHLKNSGIASGNSSLTRSVPFNKAAPPAGVPPLKLPALSTKKMLNVGGAKIVPIAEGGTGEGVEEELDKPLDGEKEVGIKPRPPTTGIPLSALGHNPDFKHAAPHQLQHSQSGVTTDGPEEQEEPYFYPGPYGRRMRKRIPMLKDMIDIDRKVRAQFGFTRGKAVFLIPAYTTVDNEGSSMAFAKKKLVKDHEHRDEQIKNPEGNFDNVGKFVEGEKKGGPSEIIDREIEIYNAHKDDDEDEFESKGEENDDLTDEDGDFDFANVNRKKTASKYHANNNGKQEKKQLTAQQSADLSLRKFVRPKDKLKQETVMGWMFRSIVDATKSTPQPKRSEYDDTNFYASDTSKSFLNPFQNKKTIDKTGKDAEPEDTIHMWTSTQCFCAFMLLSRMSRMQLVMRSRQFHMMDSERTNYILYHLRPSYVKTLLRLKEQLYEDCAKLIIPPMTLKEVSNRSFLELQILFKSNVKLCRRLNEWEEFIYYKISKYDYYLPMISVIPIFLRDIQAFDNTLLRPDKLIVNLTYEERLEQLIAKNNEWQNKRTKEKAEKQSKHNADGRNNDDFFSYDSASFAATSTVVTKDKDGKSINPLFVEQQRLRAEEKEEVLTGKMSMTLSQALDGSNYLKNGQQGVRDMLTSYLAQDECIMTWHLPHHVNQNIQVVLAWRDNSASTHTYYSSAEAYSHSVLYEQALGEKGAAKKKDVYKPDKKKKDKQKTAASKKDKNGEEKIPNRGIILEIAKSDLDTGKLMQLIANYIKALHSETAPQRTTMTTDALRSLSCALSLTEFLNMIPPHVRSLVICCPPVMRVIPWHLILIEMSSDYGTGQLNSDVKRTFGSKPVEIHLMEKFCVRLGPTLTLFELVNTAAKYHKQSVGLHRLCAVDGEAEEQRSPGVRGSDIEVACVSQIWSLDPLDYHILMNHAAAPRNIQTGLFVDGSNAGYKKFKKSIFISRHQSINPIKDTNKLKKKTLEAAPKQHKKKNLKNEAGDIDAEKLFGKMDETTHVAVSSSPNKNKYKSKNKDGTHKQDDPDEEKSNGESSSESEHDSDDNLEEAQKESEFHMRSLSLCRVLHFTSAKVPQQLIKENNEDASSDASGFEAAISLPKYEKIMTVNNKKVKLTDPRTYLTTSDIIRQVYVQNNALTIFSKFGLTDDITNVYSTEIEKNTAFVEAAHLAGANTVVHPLWSSDSMGYGLSSLAHLIFQIRFYSILPSKSRDRVSIVETVRKTQLWLKDATADAIIAFIFKASIPPKAKQLIIDEMEAIVKSSLSAEDLKHKSDMSIVSPSKAGPITAAQQESLQSPFLAPGDGVTAGNRVGGDKKFFDHFLLWGSYVVSGHGGGVHHHDLTEAGEDGFDKGIITWDDKELNNLTLEAKMLRLEGKFAEASELEKYIRQLRAKMVTDRIAALKLAGVRAGRGFMDGLDYLDKKYLDQDSDSIKLSSDEEEESSDSDDFDINDEVEEENRQLAEGNSPDQKRRQFKPRPLELDNLKPDNLAYSQWRSKVTSLNLDVKAPVISVQRLVEKKQEAIVKQNQQENYELNMQNKVTSKIDGQPQMTEAMRAARAEKKAKWEKKYAGMTPEQIAVARAKSRAARQARRDAKAAAAAEEDDSDDDSDDSWERERELQEQRKKERQTKFRQAVGEIRGDVRSYATIVQDITNGNILKNENGDTCTVC